MIELNRVVKKLRLHRYYTKEGQDVFDLDCKEFTAEWKNDAGKTVGSYKVVFPVGFDQNSVDIVTFKYMRKTGVQSHPEGRENDFRQLVARIVETAADAAVSDGFLEPADKHILRDELAYLMLNQMMAFNSPVEFNVGVSRYGQKGSPGNFFVAGVKSNTGMPDEPIIEPTPDAYTYPQISACFINGLVDSLYDSAEGQGIYGLLEAESRIFRLGSGAGGNFSKLRSKYEGLQGKKPSANPSGGGYSSGLISHLRTLDTSAGSMHSGGTCLAPDQYVYTVNGPVQVQELARKDHFYTLSWDPPANRFKVKKANAWHAGQKSVVRVVTDKGYFDLSFDHPMKLASGEYCQAGSLKVGQRLWVGKTQNFNNSGRIHVSLGHYQGRELIHRLVAQDILGSNIRGRIVHHLNEDHTNNSPDNLEVLSGQSEHAQLHNEDRSKLGLHPFQVARPKSGNQNGMHHTSEFWQDYDRVDSYRQKQSENLLVRGDAAGMQHTAATSRMMNLGYELINAGYDISTFDKYLEARKSVGRSSTVGRTRQEQRFSDRFGSYTNFYQELSANNHEVVRICEMGTKDVYDVEVDCPTTDDKTLQSGHNFLIWSKDNHTPFGSGVIVSNTRRAAKMVIVDIDHPEAIDFIDWKVKEERKAKLLLAAGVGLNAMGLADLNGEAYTTISGQNSNNTIRATDDWMKAVLNDGTYTTTYRVTGGIHSTLKARDTMEKIARAAWECADPGMQWHTTINLWNTCKASGDIEGSNPCSEYMHLNDTSCNLASLNLVKFCDAFGFFDVHGFQHACKLTAYAMEALLSISSCPTRRLMEGTFKFRTLGLGFANLGSLLMRWGVPYDSPAGRTIASALMCILHGSVGIASAEMSSVIGPYPGWYVTKGTGDAMFNNGDSHLEVVRRHLDCAKNLEARRSRDDLVEHARKAMATALDLGEDFGYRNAQWSVIAPTGTIGFMMGVDTFAAEPDYALVKFKRLAGSGGLMKIVNESVEPALKSLGYSEDQILDILKYIDEHEKIEGSGLKEKHLPIFDTANINGKVAADGNPIPGITGTRYLSWRAHVEMVAALQPFVSGSISKTVNLPMSATVEDIYDVYLEAWKLGCKCISVYRDRSKGVQVYNNTVSNVATKHKPEERPVAQRHRLSGIAEAVRHKIVIGTETLYLVIGHYEDGEPGEVFLEMSQSGTTLSGFIDAVAKLISLALQHGVPPESVARQLIGTRFEPAGIVEHPFLKLTSSPLDAIGRILLSVYSGDPEVVQGPIPFKLLPARLRSKLEEQGLSILKKGASLVLDPTKLQQALKSGPRDISAQSCGACGSARVVQSGTCWYCSECGQSNGGCG